ncbi:RHS repeat-associated core domain-containing protein [Capnocytophaga leadbetteri]|uniref:RHS repeat domain-containing protein n=1 Tax=Capnocytophaga leadbetteri TaxID=327575 RepID=UPI0028ED1C2A|nr:RHS repeat-associated core domain-containing protein [Capnocytophaga leadbetteri]
MRLAPKENFRCPFKYQGQYYDSEVELCYNRFRYYHPETGRYISEDPIGFLSGEPNFFAYVSDTNAWVDLLGLFRKPINWLSKDNININMDHILSNHTETGSGFIQSLRMGGEKDSFDPNLSKTQIEKK